MKKKPNKYDNMIITTVKSNKEVNINDIINTAYNLILHNESLKANLHS